MRVGSAGRFGVPSGRSAPSFFPEGRNLLTTRKRAVVSLPLVGLVALSRKPHWGFLRGADNAVRGIVGQLAVLPAGIPPRHSDTERRCQLRMRRAASHFLFVKRNKSFPAAAGTKEG